MQISDLRNFTKIYNRRTRLFFLITIASSISFSVCELFSIAIIIPIINFVIIPSELLEYPLFLQIQAYMDLRSDNEIRFFIISLSGIIISLITALKISLFKIITLFPAHLGIKTNNILIRKILEVEYAFLKDIEVDKYITMVNKNIEFYTYYVVLPFINLLSSGFNIIFLLGLLTYINYKIALVVFLFFGVLYSIINMFTKKQMKAIGVTINESAPKILEGIKNIILGFIEIILYSKKSYVQSNVEHIVSKNFIAQSKSLFMTSPPKFILESTAILFILVLLFYKIDSNSDLQRLIPLLSAFVLGLQKLLPSFQLGFSSMMSIKAYSYVFDGLVRTFVDLEQNKQKNSGERNEEIFLFNKVSFNEVHYSYSQNRPILTNVNLTINKGNKVFIKGESGSGKSTFIKIFCGFQAARSGNVMINDKSRIQDIMSQWRDLIAYIPQNVHIINGSFYENITYSQEVNEQDYLSVVKVAKQCLLHDFIMSKEEGYSYQIKSDLNNLSGGQLKRLCIARALFFNKSIMILDEATVGLDFKSELEIVKMLTSFGEDKTVLFISHNIDLETYFGESLVF